MPCMGPGDRKEDAQEALNDIALILREKYGVEIATPQTWSLFADKYNQAVVQLKTAVEEVFKLDSYNSF